MSLADINKWISGESEGFFDPRQTPPSVTGDSNPGEETSTAQPLIRKFVGLAIAALVGASVASAFLVILMRHSVEPSPAAHAKLPPSDSGTTFTGSRAERDAGLVDASHVAANRDYSDPGYPDPEPADHHAL